ncbi:WD40-repeat-containing domain protein [Suillus subaureus]|uniref:WD40-repeat-containing domain protein n=1 Tax=Suillus subaureus TaxID=48587 RepID=A0A9P7JB66_9AGAM|nr:WD40-repeat-containing domain protein [Suillus subaureus]KAG1812152.1 WD40-repeat-containing domain protein [Suillus subaureus]
MASASTKVATTNSILKPVMTLKGQRDYIRSISYFPDGQRMISGSYDKTARQWDLKAGKEIEGARIVSEGTVYAVAVSRDGRWVVTGGGNWRTDGAELKAVEIETGIVKTLEGHSRRIYCIDISVGNTLLASGSEDKTARIWNLETGKPVAGPFKSTGYVGAVRFSPDSKKLAVELDWGTCLEVWDVQSQKLDVRIGNPKNHDGGFLSSLVFWTNKNKNIIAAFTLNFTTDIDLNDCAKTIYEFDGVTLETVGAAFEGHTRRIRGLTISSDGALLASASYDNTMKLWAFESRQLLASFDVQKVEVLMLSSDSRQLVYTTNTNDHNIYICDTPPDILTQARIIAPKKHRRPPIVPMAPRPPPTRDTQQPAFIRLRGLLRFSPRANAVPDRYIQPRDPLNVPATLPLPSPLSDQVATRFDRFEISSPPRSNGVVQSLRHHLSFLVPRHSHGQSVVEVAPGRKVTRLLAAKLPEYKKIDDTRHPSSPQATLPQENDTADIDSLPDVHWVKAFLCYHSCWSHGTLRMPPRWRLERVDIPRQDGAHGCS